MKITIPMLLLMLLPLGLCSCREPEPAQSDDAATEPKDPKLERELHIGDCIPLLHDGMTKPEVQRILKYSPEYCSGEDPTRNWQSHSVYYYRKRDDATTLFIFAIYYDLRESPPIVFLVDIDGTQADEYHRKLEEKAKKLQEERNKKLEGDKNKK